MVSKGAEIYPHFKYDVLFLIGLFYERCLTSWWGGGGRWGVPRDGLTKSGGTNGHMERGALDNDSEATEGASASMKRSLYRTVKMCWLSLKLILFFYSDKKYILMSFSNIINM